MSSLFGLSCLDFLVSLLDNTDLESILFLHGYMCLGPLLFVYGITRLGFPLSILDLMSFESSPSAQSSARVESISLTFSAVRYELPVLVLDFVQIGPSLFLRSLAHFGFSLSTYGLT